MPSKPLVPEENDKPLPVTSSFEPEYAEEERRLYREVLLMLSKLDWDRILELAGDNWEMVFWAAILFRYIYPAQTGYVPARVWDDLIGRFISAVKNPDPKARFRGSLIDEMQFAIDVQEWQLDD